MTIGEVKETWEKEYQLTEDHAQWLISEHDRLTAELARKDKVLETIARQNVAVRSIAGMMKHDAATVLEVK